MHIRCESVVADPTVATITDADASLQLVSKFRIKRNVLHSGHEFHFSSVQDIPSDAEFAYKLKRGIGVGDGRDGWICYNTLASYMHTTFLSTGRMAERFVESCVDYSRR